ncbi:TetR/AcrR family transcriptional regulator [Paenibacillus sp. 7124]|uniref:TetR/AcrR family transcriptional regulator n=1 Tax=Paenibacillus apii TaxID=1850370 RepID=A0A6M1PE81_9BACL|nr:TetR/AcrR family transcriptional regulator [Paenibacillus apii]NGM80792.1 TetR/AcrR family transcriptional regulator [Paenibacillus apii]
MNGYERRKQKKIEQIYSVSFQLFSKHGFQKVSVNEIAQNAKVSPATIYNYFGTKEQLYVGMLMNWMDKQLEQYENILDSELSFPEKTKEIMLLEARNLKILSDEFPKFPSSELNRLVQTVESYNEQKVMQFFMKFVALGKQEGFIHKDQTDEMTILYFTMYKNELGRYWAASNEESVYRNMDQWMELFFYGLVSRNQEQEQGEINNSPTRE